MYKGKACGIGYASNSTMHHQMGIFTKGFWLGEESRIIQKNTFYQAKAVTDV